jgi:hypothetical protein
MTVNWKVVKRAHVEQACAVYDEGTARPLR